VKEEPVAIRFTWYWIDVPHRHKLCFDR